MSTNREVTDELLTIIIPCLNEKQAVIATTEGIMEIAPELPMPIKIWLVDDGSTDGTSASMEALCARWPDVCQMRVNPKNMGVGRSVLATYSAIDSGSWVSVIPGDNEFVFESIHNFMKLRHEYDVVLGYFQNPVIRPFMRRAGSYTFAQMVNVLYGFSYRYLNGMKMYRLEAFQGVVVQSGGHAYNAELIAKAILRNPRLRIGEAPFMARGRAHGISNAFKPRSMFRAIRELYQGTRVVNAYRDEIIAKNEI